MSSGKIVVVPAVVRGQRFPDRIHITAQIVNRLGKSGEQGAKLVAFQLLHHVLPVENHLWVMQCGIKETLQFEFFFRFQNRCKYLVKV